MSGLGALHRLLSQAANDGPGSCGFTLHVNFSADDEEQGRFRATQYVEALNLLRTEVDCYRAQVSPQGNWSMAVALYCNAPGPYAMDVCLVPCGHGGDHAGPGPTGRWSDNDIPTAPDTIQGVDGSDPSR